MEKRLERLIVLLFIMALLLGGITLMIDIRLSRLETIIEDINSSLASNTEVIVTLERIETLSRYERVVNLRKIERLIMKGGLYK